MKKENESRRGRFMFFLNDRCWYLIFSVCVFVRGACLFVIVISIKNVTMYFAIV